MSATKLAGFAPDADPTTPGVMSDVTNIVPSAKGFKASPSPNDEGLDALGAATVGFAINRQLDGTKRVFAGIATALYELSGATWNDVTRAVGGDYGVGADLRWSFAQFGTVAIAANKADTLQFSTSGAFANITGAPKASFVDVSNDFIMAADTNDGTYGDQSDRWWCSAISDYSDWTPATATQCTTGRLVASPGPIRAMKSLGDGFVAYKERGIFLASYAGSPVVWDWALIPGEIGAVSQSALVNVGYAHLFLGFDDFYAFDGSRPVSIGADVREWFFANLNTAYINKVQGVYDRVNGNVWWFFPSAASTSGTLDTALVFSVKQQKWGKVSITIESASEYVTPGTTYHGLGTAYSTYDDLPTGITYDSPFWTASTPVLAIIKTDHKVYSMTGAATSSAITTGNVGDDMRFSTFKRLRPRFITAPASSTLEYKYDDLYGDSFTAGATVSLSGGAYDHLWSSRWHKFVMNFTGDMEITGFAADLAVDGSE